MPAQWQSKSGFHLVHALLGLLRVDLQLPGGMDSRHQCCLVPVAVQLIPFHHPTSRVVVLWTKGQQPNSYSSLRPG
jgi:hypothetical protein